MPDKMETLPIGQAQVIREGEDITIVSYGASLRAAIEAAEELEEDSISCEIVDLLTVSPMDHLTVVKSVMKTGRCVIVHEGQRNCGIGSEVVARVNEHAFLYLEAPIKRVTGFDIPIPYFSKERYYLPDAERVVVACKETLNF